MRITEISVTSLFGIFDHIISLNLSDRITIIHGPNGFGKTIILQMVDSLFNGKYSVFRAIPFKNFKVKLNDGRVISVEKIDNNSNARQATFFDELEELEDNPNTNGKDQNKYQSSLSIKINYINHNGNKIDDFILNNTPKRGFLSILDRDIPELERIGLRKWLHLPSEEYLSHEEVLERFGHVLPFDVSNIPLWWSKIRKNIVIQLIETQRLLNIRQPRQERRIAQSVLTVKEYSQELAEIIQQKLAESAELSQSLDRTFPSRLVQQIGHSTLTEDELRDKLKELEKKRTQLQEVGLLEKDKNMDFLPTDQIANIAKDVLAVYVQDVGKKLGIFDDLSNRILLFKKIINNRFLHKKMLISNKGFDFVTEDDSSLPVTALSSGEQHELVLLYNLLFRVKPDSLILIDEPELSLHVLWQRQFLKDLEEVTELALFDVLIATHSPQIIHDRWDLTVELQGP